MGHYPDSIGQAIVYKGSRVTNEFVHTRLLVLYEDRLNTYTVNDQLGEQSSKREYLLSSRCELKPETPSEITTRTVKVTEGGAIARFLESGAAKTVFFFEVSWPASWVTSGYTSFQLAFETIEQAQEWHKLISDCLARLKEKRLEKKGASSAENSQREVLLNDSMMRSLEHGTDLPKIQEEGLQVTHSATTASTRSYARSATEAFTEVPKPSLKEYNTAARTAPDASWVPYRQTNGLAIYRRATQDGSKTNEYMVSCVVRGTPRACAEALLNPGSCTSVVGPPSSYHILDQFTNERSQVAVVTIAASGFAGEWCAPREVVLKRIIRDDDAGYYMVLFGSCDKEINLVESEEVKQAKKKAGYWKRPVRAMIRGGYTFVPLNTHSEDLCASPECLVTVVMQINLGGILAPDSWARYMVSALGWADNFTDRIVMGVMLIKDQVEIAKFAVPPFNLASSAAGDGQSSDIDGKMLARSTTMLLKEGNVVAGKARASAIIRGGAQARNKIAEQQQDSQSSDAFMDASGSITALRSAQVALETMAVSSSLPKEYWLELHVPGEDAPFKVRGPTYLKDRMKVSAGEPQFALASVDLLKLPSGPVEHIARYMPAIRQSPAPFMVVLQLVVPGVPLLGLVFTFITQNNPDKLGTPPPTPWRTPRAGRPLTSSCTSS